MTSTHNSPPKGSTANSSSFEQISILVRLEGAPIARTQLLHAIEEMEQTRTNLIGEYGDILVPAIAEPGYFTAEEGAASAVNHVGFNHEPHRRMTYGMVLSAAQGLVKVLFNWHNYQTVTFVVYQKSWSCWQWEDRGSRLIADSP